MKTSKLHIGIDLDGVLRDTYKHFIDCWNKAVHRGMRDHPTPDFKLKPFEEWTKWNLKELHDGNDPFAGCGNMYLRTAMRNAPQVDKAVHAVKVLASAGHQVYIVTACNPINNMENMIWLQKMGLFDSRIYYVNLHEKWRLSLDILIDDDPKHFEEYWMLEIEGLDAKIPKCYIVNQPWTNYELSQLEIGAIRKAADFMNPWTSGDIKRYDSLWDVVVDMMNQNKSS